VTEPVLFTPEGLVGGACGGCERRHFPLAPWCPWCGVEGPAEVTLSNEGRLWSWTSVLAAPPGYDGPVPYVLGVVELPADGLRVVTRLSGVDADRLDGLHEGLSLRYQVVPLGDGLGTWAYGPEAS
jgi:uncharacterized OB-fold protein